MQINKPDPDIEEFLKGLLRQTYLDGQCYELAIALNRGLDWELVGLLQEHVVRHAAVRHPEGGYFDARGHVTEDEFIKPFGNGTITTFNLQDDLRRLTRPIPEHSIMMAGKLVMSAFPYLPWKHESYISAIREFVEDLEKLSRKHGFWLIGQLPASSSWPRIVVAHDDEEGYEIEPIGNGDYVINRKLRD